MKFLRLLVVVVVVVGLLLKWLRVDLGPALLWVAGAAEALLMLIVVTGLIRLWRARSAATHDESQPRGWDAVRVILRESLPEGPAEAVLSEMRMFVAAMATLTLRPRRHPITPGRIRFGAMGSGVYGATVTALMILLLIEAPAVHLVLGAVMDEGVVRTGTRGVLLFSSIYLGIWLLGDLRLLKESPGVVLGKERLELDLGLRARGEVGFDEIVRAEVVGSGSGEDTDGDVTPIRITPMPTPNCRVWLRQPVTIRGLVGIPMCGDRLDIFVDDPSALVQALGERGEADRSL